MPTTVLSGATSRSTTEPAPIRVDRAEYLRAGSHHDVGCQSRVALAVGFAGPPQGYPLIQQALITDHGGFTDHHAHAVVDEHPLADLGAGMDFDTGEPAA